MSEYLVLARKYRSATFDEVVGQEPIAQTLKNAIATGRVAHAYLFTGTRGVGKTTMARILAKALNCLSFDRPTITPCNTCDACKSIAKGEDVDVLEIDGASNRGIDEIRELRANAIFRPSRSRYKIYYIDEVHQITRDAFNALLKTLEEPPEHVKFIFATTEANKVPATILSRCQRFDFRNIPTRDIAGHLAAICKAEKVQADQDAIFRISRAAAGSMRDGLSLLDQLLSACGGKVTDADVVRVLGTPSDERMLSMVGAIAGGSAAKALGELDGVLEAGVSLFSVVGSLSESFRNMMIALTCGPESDLIELPEQPKAAIVELSKRFSLPVLVQAVHILAATSRNLRTSSVGRALVEAAVVRLAEADKFIDPASLLERIESLQAGRAPAQHPPATSQSKKNLTPESQSPPPASARGGTGLPAGQAGFQPVANGQTAPAAGLAGPSANPTSSAAPTPSSALVWNTAWLSSNWRQVIDALISARQMPIVGLVSVAKVQSFIGGTLTLAYEAQHESLRQKVAGPQREAVQKAISELAGTAVRVEAASAAYPGNLNGASGAPPRTLGGLSSDEKKQIMQDPAVKAVTDLFGGEVVDIRRNIAQEQPPDEEPTE